MFTIRSKALAVLGHCASFGELLEFHKHRGVAVERVDVWHHTGLARGTLLTLRITWADGADTIGEMNAGVNGCLKFLEQDGWPDAQVRHFIPKGR